MEFVVHPFMKCLKGVCCAAFNLKKRNWGPLFNKRWRCDVCVDGWSAGAMRIKHMAAVHVSQRISDFQ